jgi:hypothetical protein
VTTSNYDKRGDVNKGLRIYKECHQLFDQRIEDLFLNSYYFILYRYAPLTKAVIILRNKRFKISYGG